MPKKPSVINHSDPPSFAYTITPSDTESFAPTRGLMVGVSGNVNVKMAGDGTVIALPLLAGLQYSCRVTQVLSSSTDATNIIGFW